MAANSLPLEIRRFISRHIAAVEQLEVLCLLSENPGRQWSIADVFREIQSSEKSVAKSLEDFQRAGLLTMDPQGRYQFTQANDEESREALALAKAYRERRVSVIECIYTKPADSIQDFADAFRFRKEK